MVAAIFERETLGQRWSNPIFYSTLLNQEFSSPRVA